jgi:hypothetical protein
MTSPSPSTTFTLSSGREAEGLSTLGFAAAGVVVLAFGYLAVR